MNSTTVLPHLMVMRSLSVRAHDTHTQLPTLTAATAADSMN